MYQRRYLSLGQFCREIPSDDPSAHLDLERIPTTLGLFFSVGLLPVAFEHWEIVLDGSPEIWGKL